MIKLISLLVEQQNKPKVLFVGNYQLGNAGSFAKQLIRTNDVSGKIISKYNTSYDYIKNSAEKALNDTTYNSLVILVHPMDFGTSGASSKRKNENIIPGYNFAIQLAKSNDIPVIVVMISSLNTDPESLKLMNDWANGADVDNVLDFTTKFKSSKNFSDNFNLSKSSYEIIKNNILPILNSKYVSSDVNTDTSDVDSDSEDETTASVKNKVNRKNKPGNVRSFINTFKDIAIEHQEKYGIPASITLAQGALESGWGASYLASSGNNYFGIKCHSWAGEKIYADDDAKGECFRKYDSPEESFNDHALFLKQNGRYKSLFKTKDYLEWAYGLQAAGYATSQKYATSLINLIETFGLDEYDDRPADDTTVDDTASDEKIKLTNLAGRKLNVYSPYGMRKRGMHRGIDYSPMPVGSKIYIVMPGTVREAGNIDPDGWGNTIMVDHEDGTTTLYAHLSSIDVKKGDTVKANMFIGKTGGALGTPGRGNSEGAHLHWEYHPGGYTGKASAVDGELVANKYFKIV